MGGRDRREGACWAWPMIETVDRQTPAEHLVRTGGDGADSAVMQVVEIGFQGATETLFNVMHGDFSSGTGAHPLRQKPLAHCTPALHACVRLFVRGACRPPHPSLLHLSYLDDPDLGCDTTRAR